MDINKSHYAFFTYIAKYLGVALIAGSVVHIGTLQNGVTRYVVLIGIGLILTIIGNIKVSGNATRPPLKRLTINKT